MLIDMRRCLAGKNTIPFSFKAFNISQSAFQHHELIVMFHDKMN